MREFFLAISGLVAFIANVLSIINVFNITHIEIGSISIKLPSIELGQLGSVHVTFAFIFYLTLVLAFWVKKMEHSWEEPLLFGCIIAFSFIPTVSLLLWALAFFPYNPWPLGICLFGYTIFRAVWLTYCYIDVSPVAISELLLFPASALLLVHHREFDPLWAWGCAGLAAVFPIFVVVRSHE